MSYLEVFGGLTRVGVEVSKFCGVGAGGSKPEAKAESESEKCDSAHLWCQNLTMMLEVMCSSTKYNVYSHCHLCRFL